MQQMQQQMQQQMHRDSRGCPVEQAQQCTAAAASGALSLQQAAHDHVICPYMAIRPYAMPI